MLHVRDLPVVKIAQLLIFSENDYMYFIFVCQVVGWGLQPFKIFFEQLQEVGCVIFQYFAQLFLAWSVVVNLSNNGVSLYLQKLVDLNHFIRIAVHVVGICTCRCLEQYWGRNVLIWGLRMGPQSVKKFAHP